MDPSHEKLFFDDPAVYRQPPGDFGVLYLLRRDIKSCMDHSILWPGAMAIMAGVDLLAKFLAGNDTVGFGKRFRAFVERYFRLATSEADLIYQLRNSLLHSFSLYFESSKGVARSFQLVACVGKPLIESGSAGKERVNLLALGERFDQAIEAYRVDLQADVSLQQNFDKMFLKYGSFPIV